MSNAGEGETERGAASREGPARPGRPVKIIALVKPFRAQAVLSALESMEILGGTVREAMGYGRQKNRLGQYLGSEYNTSFLPKVQLTVFVEEEHAAAVIKAIVGQARTGRIGDGKVLVLPCLGETLSW
ncbi:MAG TPA: P-II family nitrogen regulator [Isosphaeraceae bacterium]|nr:P-II family nitrogen regulator [Isosphaeraceae bacterium]